MAQTQSTVYVDAFLWEHLTSAPRPRPALEVIPGSGNSSPELPVRGGMHDATVLSHLLGNNGPFTGLVVSIGVNAASGGDRLLRSIANFVVGLLGESDFTCRTARDEFLLICPGLHGADAHRRLRSIAEQLWDYQLRTIGTSSVMFSWDAVDVKRQRLVDAIATAHERMSQTRRTRETVALDSVPLRRKAV